MMARETGPCCECRMDAIAEGPGGLVGQVGDVVIEVAVWER